MTREDYLHHVSLLLGNEGIELQLQLKILETIDELLGYYSVEFVQDLLPTLFDIGQR